MKKAFCEEPTERQKPTGIWVFLSMHADAQIRDSVAGVGDAFDRLRLDAVWHLVHADRALDRADRDLGVERHRHAVGAERGLQPHRGLRPVAVVRHVLFARPHQLDRLADLLGDQNGLAHFVVIAAASEAAAEEAVVDGDLLRLEAGGRRRQPQRAHRDLRADPDVELVAVKAHGGVERLHLRMRGMRRLVERLDDLAAPPLGESVVDIAVVARVHHRPVERVAIELGELRAVGLAGRARVPFRLEQRERFLGAPVSGRRSTATASASLTTRSTPRRPLIGVSSTLLSLPPATGQAAIAA